MLTILQRRKVQDDAAETTTLNRISARSISNLFDECKSAASRDDIKQLAHMYGMEYNVSSFARRVQRAESCLRRLTFNISRYSCCRC